MALLRVTLGIVYVMHGWSALTQVGPAGTAAFIGRIGYPPGLAGILTRYLIAAHLVGGLLLIVGLWTPWAALAQVPIMASAVFLVHWPQGFFLRGILLEGPPVRASAGGYEYPLLVLVSTLALTLLGPGAPSVDAARTGRPRVLVP